ncbi:hypothetical protein HK096_003218 [Nowakowskiella sp. JEL0078]|nr:hypothetical protein HK096_003218 [Nowakowskiella sp. JEL0078]
MPDRFIGALPLQARLSELMSSDTTTIEFLDMTYQKTAKVLHVLFKSHLTLYLGIAQLLVKQGSSEFNLEITHLQNSLVSTVNARLIFSNKACIVAAHDQLIVIGEKTGDGYVRENLMQLDDPVIDVYNAEAALVVVKRGVIAVQVDGAKVVQDTSGRLLEMAVFFGDVECGNPFVFRLERGAELEQSCLKICEDIVASHSQNFSQMIDLKTQLAEKMHRLERIVYIISEQGLFETLSMEARFRLMTNGQKISSATKLWQYQNHIFGKTDSSDSMILSNAITLFAREKQPGIVVDEDSCVRSFFTFCIAEIGKLIKHIQRIEKKDKYAVCEANRAILIIIKTAMDYESNNLGMFKLFEEDDFAEGMESWLYNTDLIDRLIKQYDSTYTMINAPNRSNGLKDIEFDLDLEEEVDDTLKNQICDLADCLLRIESCLFKASGRTTVSKREMEKRGLEHQNLTSRVILPLVRIGRQEIAFTLSETYCDFQSLVDLCINEQDTKRKILKPDEQYICEGQRMHTYIKRFHRDFAFVLYKTLLERNLLRELIEQDEMCDPLLADFLNRTGGIVHEPRIAWIHDVKMGKFFDAAVNLWNLVEVESDLKTKKNALSIAKLSFIASAEVVKEIDGDEFFALINRTSEFISIQEAMFQRMTIESKHPEQIIHTRVPNLQTQFSGLYDHLVLKAMKRLVKGQWIGPEDILELVTLTAADPYDFVIAGEALEIAAETLKWPDEALRSVWRRAWIWDRWDEILQKAARSTDERTEDMLRETAVFGVITLSRKTGLTFFAHCTNFWGKGFQPVPIADCFSMDTPQILAAKYPDLTSEQTERVFKDLQKENVLLDGVLTLTRVAEAFQKMITME